MRTLTTVNLQPPLHILLLTLTHSLHVVGVDLRHRTPPLQHHLQVDLLFRLEIWHEIVAEVRFHSVYVVQGRNEPDVVLRLSTGQPLFGILLQQSLN
jgi:hypothetical protein